MPADAASPPPQANVSIDSVLGVQQHTLWQRIIGAQSFWVTIALIIICVVMSFLQPASFATPENFYNITRNFSFIGIMALGHDRRHRDRRHRPLGRLDHGPRRGLQRPGARGRLSLVGGRACRPRRGTSSSASSTD